MVHCTYTESWPESTKTACAPYRIVHGKRATEASEAGSAAGAGAAPPAKRARCPPSSARVLASNLTALPLAPPPRNSERPTVTVGLFEQLFQLAATVPVSTEVERALARSFRMMRSKPNVMISRDILAIQAARNPMHARAKVDEDFRSELVLDLLQYVSNALESAALLGTLSSAGEQQGTVAAAFPADLDRWVTTAFLPFVRERLPGCMLSPLLSAACDLGGQPQLTPASLSAVAGTAAPGPGGASMLTAARRQRGSGEVPSVALPDGRNRWSVPAARRLAFAEFQHLSGRCEKCAAVCRSARSRLVCSCGAICCSACYGFRVSICINGTGYQCDACREEHKRAAVVHPHEDFLTCFECMAELPRTSLSEIQTWCPGCRRRFCQRCAAVARIEGRNPAQKRRADDLSMIGEGSGVVTHLCPTCSGSEEYEKAREEICSKLLQQILGRKNQEMQQPKFTRNQLVSSKAAADEFGDLLYDLYFNGFRDAFARFLPWFLGLVVAQLGASICPSVDPFHLLYYMGQDSKATPYLLSRVCRAQATEYLSKGGALLPKTLEAGLASRETLPEGRPRVVRVGIYGSDLVMNSPTADLMCPVLDYFIRGPDSERFEFFLFADGPPDVSHPSAKHIVELFPDRLELFTHKMSSKAKYSKIVDKGLHALLTLTGWTHGHIADVIAAVGSGPSRVVVFNYLGWAGPFMRMPEAVHFTIVGLHALSQRQKLECEASRERVAVVSCYQPAQGPWSHPTTGDKRWTRTYFNLPAAADHFMFFFTGSTNRIIEAIFLMWLDIVHRVVGSCLLLLSKPKGMRMRIKKWIAKYVGTANPDFDPSRVIFRPFQNKTHFCGMIRAMLENGAGACLDSVEPIALHTSAADVFGNGGAVLTYPSDNGFHQRVVTELHGEYGTQQHCVANSRAEFPDLCVRFALNKPLQRAMQAYLLRVNAERVRGAKLPRQLLQVFDRGFAMFREADRDFKKLQDFCVTDELLPVQTFAESPEFEALAAAESGPAGAKRKALLAELRTAELEERMEPHALQILEDVQMKGLSLQSVVGAGAFSIVIAAAAERTIGPTVPAGTKVALKLSREGVPADRIRNHSLAREATNTILLEKRLDRKAFSDMIPAPIFLWDSSRTGRCFWGHTAADDHGICLLFECVELIDSCFGDVIRPFGEQWMQQAVLGEGFQDLVLRPLFQLFFELRDTAGLSVIDFKPANMGRRANGRCAIWDLGHAVVNPLPKASERVTNDLPVPLIQDAPLAIDTEGQTVKRHGRRLVGKKDPDSRLFLVSNQRTSDYCRALTEQGMYWGRNAGGTPGYADQALKGGLLTPEHAYAYDIFAVGRTVLKLLTHDRRRQSLTDWVDSACRAAAAGPAGIQRMLEKAVDPCARIRQGLMVERLASLLAAVLHPDPTMRIGAQRAMLHAANTLPLLSPEYSLALEDGTGILIQGGPVESLPMVYRKFPALKGKSLPDIALLVQPSMGLGARLCGRALKKGEAASVYGGAYVPRSDTGRMRSLFPSRYGVSVIGVKGFDEAFVCDAAQTPERPFKWFIDNRNAGPFMNGRRGVGLDINCDLDRSSAWLDEEGGVWFLLKANRDIEEGEWLMWNYDWTAGAGIVIPGLTFAFD